MKIRTWQDAIVYGSMFFAFVIAYFIFSIAVVMAVDAKYESKSPVHSEEVKK